MSVALCDARTQKHVREEQLTGDDLGALEVLVRMEVAWGQSKPEADKEQQQIGTAPHVEVGFFSVDPRQASARPCLCF